MSPKSSVLIAAYLCPVLAASSAPAPVPEVRMLVPGFVVEEIPIPLSNVNNLRFAPDGSLTALGYNGKIWQLRDTNGDGMEDTATPWWDGPGLTVPVGMCWTSRGLLVSSSGKVSLLSDTDNSGTADTEQIVASGWPDKEVASGNVDATGVTMDRHGNVVFGLLTANYSDPYQIRKIKDLQPADRARLARLGREATGAPTNEVSLYDPHGARGSVQMLEAGSQRLRTLATGVRVPYHFAFNRAGDLFMTDQEGETWCPNGNPLDELNHIIPGHHYGFPPRHEKWIPNLESEPPVVGFGPQHQSACGFVFNEPHGSLGQPPTSRPRSESGSNPADPWHPSSPAQGLFGPKAWEGNALVAGESRGKIWRVALGKSGKRYQGKPALIARLWMLTTDLAISPRGDLYVSCHSGLPDWGTGPTGQGKIFRIRYVEASAPQPTGVAALSPTKLQITFDRALDPSVVELNSGMKIDGGASVRAGHRFEVLKPPYATVARQDTEPRTEVRVHAMRLSEQNRILLLETEPHPWRAFYAFALHGIKARRSALPPQTIELDYDLTGTSFQHWKLATPASSVVQAQFQVQTGGDFDKGRALFHSEQLKCGTCHRIRGEGTGLGPDLSQLHSKGSASILSDIRQPSAAINPDYVGYIVRLRQGDEFTGFVRFEGAAQLKLQPASGGETVISPLDILEMRPSSVSLMPEGLLEYSSESDVADLLAYLMRAP